MRINISNIAIERWPLRVPFRISRGAKTEAVVVTVTLTAGGHVGRGECCPYPRYGESPEAIKAILEQIDLGQIARLAGAGTLAALRHALLTVLPTGSARNALDCALWDLEAKTRGTRVWCLAGLPEPAAALTSMTLSLSGANEMAAAAREFGNHPLLKLKLGGGLEDIARMQAVRLVRPDARLVADANEAWSETELSELLTSAAAHRLELIEQPLPAEPLDADMALAGLAPPVPVCADEAAAPGIEAAALIERYQAINIKLDKTGGLTAALELTREAQRLGLRIMVGSMVSTSLSMAPAMMLAGLADWVDLDSPLLLARDRAGAMTINAGVLSPPTPALWG